MYHKYTISNAQKAQEMLAILSTPNGKFGPAGAGWGLMTPAGVAEYLRRYGDLLSPSGSAAANTTPSMPALGSNSTDPYSQAPGANIQGWMTGEELNWLYETAKALGSVVEIGSWKGRSTYALCASGCPRVIAVDHFRGSGEHQKEFGFAHGWGPLPDFQRNILETFKNVELKQMPSSDAVRDFTDLGIDMVFIDGAHEEYEAVLADIAAWEPKARTILAVHCQSHASVRRATGEYFRREPDQVVGDIGIFRK